MISFNCPSCGKHFTFSRKFAGRKLTCAECKTENVVPEPVEELGLAPLSEEEEPRPVLIPKEAVRPIPQPPPLPVGIAGVREPGMPMATEATGTTVPGSDALEPFPDLSSADSAILAFVFEEKQKSQATPPTPPPLPLPVQAVKEPPPQSNTAFWTTVLSAFGLVVGLGAYLTLFVDWRGLDPRMNQVNDLKDRSIQTTIQENEKKSESRSLRLHSSKAWSETNKLFDSIVQAFSEADDKRHYLKETENLLMIHTGDETLEEKKTEIQESLSAAINRLDELWKQSMKSLTLAANSEVDSVVAANDAKLLKLESEFYTKQEQKLRSDIASQPESRIPTNLEPFDTEKNRIPLDESFTLTSDWTENFFRRFDFPESNPDRFFVAFDYARKLSGDKSLRVTSLTTQPITVLFPEHRNAQADLSEAKYFNFSLRFPDVTDTIANSATPNGDKIGGMSVRFGNAAGVVEFQTISPRYCESLFFDGRGRFVSIEFPLDGDQFWRRIDNIDMTKLERLADDSEPMFFSRINWVELYFVPRSPQTTLWIDSIFLSEKRTRQPYDLFRAEKSQEDQRKREEERFRDRRR